jgi:ubiquitin-like protein Pup
MAEREQIKKSAPARQDEEEVVEEIDDVLETNAEEFVKAYVQKGGQ